MSAQQHPDTAERNQAKKSAIRWTIILAGVLAAVLALTTYTVQPLIAKQYLLYRQVAEGAIAGYFAIHFRSIIFYKLALVHSALVANSIKSLVRIAGAIIVIAFIISYLAQDPILAASLTTTSGLVIGFASSNLIGNVIAGLYLAIARPFKIGDRIKVFGETGTVIDISLLYTKLILQTQNEMLASNSSMVTTQVVLIKEPAGLKSLAREKEQRRRRPFHLCSRN